MGIRPGGSPARYSKMTTMRNDPDVIALVERARAGDEKAWDQIVRRYATLVWAVCRNVGVVGGEADDVAATVWLRLVERLGTLREPAALPGWIVTTTRRECFGVLRARTRVVPVDQEQLPAPTDPVADPVPDEWLLAEERRLALRIAFEGLSERCRQLLSLLFRDPPAPYAEISGTMDLKIPSIGPTRIRCLEKLREQPGILALMDVSTAGR
jgi:RNA polymerase sigma factor (sigma-70 family)